VLLVIFMVTAPMMQQGFGVKLPQARNAPPASSEPIFVTVPLSFHQDQRVQIGTDWVHLPALSERARQAMDGRTEKSVTMRLDGGVTVTDEVAVWNELNRGGVQSVTIATQPHTTDK
jgi:biopolymer transport protein TolR